MLRNLGWGGGSLPDLLQYFFSAIVTKMEQTKNKMEEADAEQNLRKKRRKKFLLVALLALLVIFIIIGKC